MMKRRPRSRTLVSVLAAVALLPGALAATSAPAGAARTSAKASSASAQPAAPITSPVPDRVFTPGSAIRLQAAPFPLSDAVRDGLSMSPVSKIAFYASTNLTNNRLVGVAKSAPWTVRWAKVPAGDYSLTAVTTDEQGNSTTSDPVAIQVEKPSVVTSQSSLTIAQGHAASTGVSS